MSAALWSERVVLLDGRAVVTPPAFLDVYTRDAFRHYLADAFARSLTRDIVIRMAVVELCDEDGLGCLVGAVRRARELDSTVYLLQPPTFVIDRLSRTGLLSRFTLIEDLGELDAPVAARAV